MSALCELNIGGREDGGASDELFSPSHTQNKKSTRSCPSLTFRSDRSDEVLQLLGAKTLAVAMGVEARFGELEHHLRARHGVQHPARKGVLRKRIVGGSGSVHCTGHPRRRYMSSWSCQCGTSHAGGPYVCTDRLPLAIPFRSTPFRAVQCLSAHGRRTAIVARAKLVEVVPPVTSSPGANAVTNFSVRAVSKSSRRC